jgi:putative ABC transport system permease protein
MRGQAGHVAPGRRGAAAGGRHPGGWRRSGWRAIWGTGAAGTLALALTVFCCVFLATAGPRVSLAMRTQALRRQLAAVPALQRSVQVTADWYDFSFALPVTKTQQVQAGPSGATTGQIGEVSRQVAHDLAATPLPVRSAGSAGTEPDWAELSTGYDTVSGAAPSAVLAGTPPQVGVIYRDPLNRYAVLAAGRYPRSATLEQGRRTGTFGVRTAPRGADLEVAVTQAVAARFRLHPGSHIAAIVVNTPVTLTVTGVLRPLAPGSAFWTADPAAAAPVLVPRTPFNPAYWEAAVFTGPGEVAAMQRLFPGDSMQFGWDFPISVSRVDADHAQALAADLSRAVSRNLPLAGALSSASRHLNVTTPGPAQALSAFLTTQNAVETVLSLLFAGLAAIGAIVVLLAGQLAASLRRVEFALIRARGAAVWQLALLALGDSALAALPGAAAGAALAAAVTPDGFPPATWWLAGLTMLAALAGQPAAVVALHRDVRASDAAGRREPERGTARPARERRWVAECALALAAIGGLVVLRQQGVPGTGGLNLYPAAAPVLIAIPAALLAMRTYPLLLRGLLRLSGRRAGVTWFTALTRAARAGTVSVLPVFALVLALVLAAFAGMVRDAVTRGETAASWQSLGADAVVASGALNGGFSAVDTRRIAAVPGAAHAAPVRIMTGALPSGGTADIAAVNPASYAALVSATPWRRFPAAALAPRTAAGAAGHAGPVPVLASRQILAALGRGPVTIRSESGPVVIRIAGTLGSTPAFPASTRFIVMPLAAVRSPSGAFLPNEILLTGAHLRPGQLAAVVRRTVPWAVVRLRSAALSALAGAPLQHGTYVLFAVGIPAAAGFGVIALLLSLVLGAGGREQTLTRLATLGMSAWQARLAAIGENLPALLAAIAAGAVCAALLAPLVGPVLNLSVFTGSAAGVPVRADFAALATPAAGLALLALAALAAEFAAARRRGLATALRAGA